MWLTSKLAFVSRGILTFVLVIILTASGVQAQPTPEEWPRAGLNLEWQELMNWSPAIPFNNLFKIADPFSGASVYDSLGYPLSGLPAVSVVYIGENLPVGDFTLKWEGQGTFTLTAGEDDYNLSGPCPPQGVSIPITNSATYIELRISATNSDDHLRGMRLHLPGYDDDSPHAFNDCFLSAFEPPIDVIRPMWWARVPNSDIQDWAERPKLQQYSYGGDVDDNRGTAYEHMIDICNLTGSDLWITVPVMANDNFVTQLAGLIKNRLADSLNIFVEYSNESPWHYWFEYHDSVEPAEVGLAGFPGDDGAIYAGHKYAARAAEVLQLFDEAFGSESDRLIGVLGAQFGWTAMLEQELEAVEWLGKMELFDAFSPAPYVGDAAPVTAHWPDTEAVFDSLDYYVQGIMDGSIAPGPSGDKGDPFTDFINLAAAYDKQLVAYEAGQHFTSWQAGLTEEQVTTLNLHPRMYGWYQQYMQGWFDHAPITSTLVFYTSYAPCPGGGSCFGVKTACDQPIEEAHKYRAIVDWLEGNIVGQDEAAAAPPPQLMVFPNPTAEGQLNIVAEGLPVQSIRLLDMNGRVARAMQPQANTGSVQLNVAGLKGVYLLLLETEVGLLRRKVVML
ncbi:MAG: T9SS type A sorting domain-containing protein [Bacteroidetes bacterium]|jgi:hypothetical protein|nr:T9SS type A sorting domain-containing protein [Bacteroidota bacterium]